MELFPENNEIARLYRILRGQVRENGSPDVIAVIMMLDLYKVDNREEVFDDLILCFNITARIENEKDKKEDD